MVTQQPVSGRTPKMTIKRSEWAVLAVTLAYIAGFGTLFLSTGNSEFLWYIVTLLILVTLVGAGQRKAAFPTAILWALSLWGLVHMAGGGVPVGDSVLYAHVVVPVFISGDIMLLRYDQIVHFYGFGVTAWLLWYLLRKHFPVMDQTRSIYVFAALGSMGLGAVNEMIEFAAVVMFPQTNVGGYVNTALDLVFNAVGAVFAMIVLAVSAPKSSATST
ncbi:MAG: DUF2238 domain-containing protein [Proteobacteria bacterium]|nr:DUF2238 domain-containing protein [Pseudomonadota bacterium]